MKEDLVTILIKTAQNYQVDAELVCAIAQCESNIDALAIRYEPGWKYILNAEIFAKKNNITNGTEIHLQAMSYGVMQIMGSVCRELFYQGPLTALISDPALTINLAVKKLKMFLDRYGNEEDAIACWNAGNRKKYVINGLLQYSNQSYVDKVTRVLKDLRSTKIKTKEETKNG